MASQNTHVILNHLDKPVRLLMWEVPHVMAVIIPSMITIAFGRPFSGVFVGIVIAIALRSYKRRYGHVSFAGFAYWFFPHQKDRMPLTPPSYIREFLD